MYKYVNIRASENKETVNYIFVRSNKDDDTAADDFNRSFGKEGKYELDNVKVIELDNVSDSPLLYKNRGDNKDGKPISASTVREDIRNNDFDKFLKSYQIIRKSEITIDKKYLQKCFDKWKKEIKEPEDK